MIGDHHGGTAGRASLLARAMDEILGTHRAKQTTTTLPGPCQAKRELAEPHVAQSRTERIGYRDLVIAHLPFRGMFSLRY
jgi:hypothetical protein